MPNGIARVLCITSSDANWLWLSDAVGDRMMLVRESGTFAEISKRVGLVSPNAAIVDFSPQVGLDPSLIVKELTDLSPELPVIALGSKAATDALVKALRSGVRDFLDLESSPGEIQKVMGTVLEKAPRPSGERKGYALMVLGARQGVGATTLSVNLAAQLNKSTTIKLCCLILVCLWATPWFTCPAKKNRERWILWSAYEACAGLMPLWPKRLFVNTVKRAWPSCLCPKTWQTCAKSQPPMRSNS